jgi:hypothetical protein
MALVTERATRRSLQARARIAWFQQDPRAHPHPENAMKDSQLKALLKKTQSKASQAKKPARQAYDSTLEATRTNGEPLQGSEAEGIFKEMKRREF